MLTSSWLPDAAAAAGVGTAVAVAPPSALNLLTNGSAASSTVNGSPQQVWRRGKHGSQSGSLWSLSHSLYLAYCHPVSQ